MRIFHIIDAPIPTGRVEGCIHWPRRFDHMQQHTGQHLLSAVFQERFGLVTVSFHLGETVSTIDLQGPQPSPLILEGAARAANGIIFEDREITVRYGTAEEFADQGARKHVERKGILRAIEITGIDLQPCGGTHLRRTGQLGLILLRNCSKIRQDWRVEFLCGGRAEAAARADATLIAQLADKLKCAPLEVGASVERVLHEREAAAKRVKVLLPKVADADAAAILTSTPPQSARLRIITQLTEGAEPEYLQLLATALTRTEQVVAILVDKVSGGIVLAQNSGVGQDMNTLLKKVLDQLGGKGGGTKDFARGALVDPANASSALALANSLL